MSEKKPLKAVSLKYPDELPLPFISSSGKNEVAQKILEVAKENNIHTPNLNKVFEWGMSKCMKKSET